MKKIVVLSGSGISAESGLKTFRDAGGLWEGFNVYDVATPEGWAKDPEMVLKFYNDRRKQALKAEPNRGHIVLAELEENFDVSIITQNVDDLHEKAGSSNVIHLHGELFKARSTVDENLIYEIEGWELNIGDTCEKGSQLRPHIVWFGELVPMMEVAAKESMSADIFIVVGTSLQVYPAAGLLQYAPDAATKYIVDPNIPEAHISRNMRLFQENASTGLEKVKNELLST